MVRQQCHFFSSLVGFQRLHREHSLRESAEDMLTVTTEIMLSLLSPSIQIIACLQSISKSSLLVLISSHRTTGSKKPHPFLQFKGGSLALCGLAISPCLRYIPGLHIHSPPQALNGVERGRQAGYQNMYCRNKVGRCPTHQLSQGTLLFVLSPKEENKGWTGGKLVIGREMFESLSAATRRHLHEDLFPSQLQDS